MQKKILIFSLIPILIIVLIFAVFSALNSERYYKQGLDFEKKNDFQNAYYNFSKINLFSKLYSLALYKQATNAKMAHDNKTAIKKYSKYIAIVNDPILSPVGYWELGNLHLENKNKKRALRIFKKLQKKYPESDFAKAAAFREGKILLKENPKYALSCFIKYLHHAPSGRFSKVAIQYIENSNLKLTAEDKLVIAISLYRNELFDKSILYLKQIPFKNAWFYLVKNYEEKNMLPNALQICLRGLSSTQAGEISEDDIKNAVNFYLSNNPHSEKQLYNITNKKNNIVHEFATLNYAQSLPDHMASTIYLDLYNKKGKYAPQALTELIFYNYKIKKYKEAIRLGNLYMEIYNKEKTSPKTMFFLAKTYEKQNKKTQAQGLYKKILYDFPDSYYAFRANARLTNEKQSFKTDVQKILPTEKIKIDFPIKNSGKTSHFLNKLARLNDIGAIEDFKIENEFIKSWIAYQNKRHSYSLLLARDEAEKTNKLNKEQRQLANPLYYQNSINKYAKMQNLSPFLIIALIKKESHFDASAKSIAGAKGLMQVLPATAQFIEKESYQKDKMEDIDYNIYVGTRYFASIKKQLNGDEMLSVAAYNAGPGNVRKWLQTIKTNDADIFVESIPFVETKDYVKKVYQGYWNYLRLYSK